MFRSHHQKLGHHPFEHLITLSTSFVSTGTTSLRSLLKINAFSSLYSPNDLNQTDVNHQKLFQSLESTSTITDISSFPLHIFICERIFKPKTVLRLDYSRFSERARRRRAVWQYRALLDYLRYQQDQKGARLVHTQVQDRATER